MAYTDPRTWTDGELVTASIMNTHVRDNFDAMGPHLLALKSADESVISSTVLQNDDALFFAIGATEKWLVHLSLYVVGGSSGDVKVAFTIPASATMSLSTTGRDTSNAMDYFLWVTSGTAEDMRAASQGYFYAIEGIVSTAGTAGNFQVQWAQSTSVASNCTVKAGSALYGLQLA